jgi:peptide/nickel transport system substrate-binding protein
MRRRSRTLPALFVTAAMAAVAMGCGSSDADSDTATPTDEAPVTTAAGGAEPETNDADGSEISGTLRVAVDSVGADSLDPKLYASAPQQTTYAIIYDSLITKDPATGELAPGLATEWSVDGNVWTLKIREGVTFHDGSPLTAEDVKFTLERFTGLDGGEAIGSGASVMRNYLVSIETTDEFTVEVVTTDGAPTFPYNITMNDSAAGWVVPKDYVERVGEEEFQKNPIGTGPFRFVSAVPGSSMTFEVNEEYWGQTPTVETLELQIVPDVTTRYSMLRAGEVDLISGLTGPAIPQALNDSDLQTFISQRSAISFFVIGGKTNPDSPLSNADVRKAISTAIDREAIVDAILHGAGAPAYLYNFPASIGSSEEMAEQMRDTYDVDAARALLAEAGYEDGFELSFWAQTSGSDFANAVAQNLEAIGISVDLEIVDTDALLSEMQSDQGKQQTRILQIFGANGQTAKTDFTSSIFSSFDPESPHAQPFDNPEFWEALDSQRSESDPDARWELVAEVVRLNFEAAEVIPGWYIDTVFAAGSNVTWEPLNGSSYPQNLQSVRID